MDVAKPPPESLYPLLLLALLLLSMFFSASETAILSSSKLRIRYLKEKKSKPAERVQKLLAKKASFLNAIVLGNTIVNIASSVLITAMCLTYFGDAGVGIATAITATGLLIFGEILPKSFALSQPEPVALRFSLPLTVFVLITKPVVAIFSSITRAIMRIAGIRKKTSRFAVTEEDIKTLIEQGQSDGLFDEHERTMLEKIIKYTDLNARDIMTPRTDITAISITSAKDEILALSASSRFSRFPVFGESIDDIRGILYIKDFLFSSASEGQDFSVKTLLRPALFVFENQKISVLQEKLRKENQNIAIIIDEYGGTSGLVTTLDLVEEIFGKAGGLASATEKAGTESWLIQGSERLDILNEKFGSSLSSAFYDTIGGLLMEKAGEVPLVGSSVSVQGLSFTVQTISGNRIESVLVERTGGNE